MRAAGLPRAPCPAGPRRAGPGQTPASGLAGSLEPRRLGSGSRPLRVDADGTAARAARAPGARRALSRWQPPRGSRMAGSGIPDSDVSCSPRPGPGRLPSPSPVRVGQGPHQRSWPASLGTDSELGNRAGLESPSPASGSAGRVWTRKLEGCGCDSDSEAGPTGSGGLDSERAIRVGAGGRTGGRPRGAAPGWAAGERAAGGYPGRSAGCRPGGIAAGARRPVQASESPTPLLPREPALGCQRTC
jgi:hypothetical protein